MTGLELIGTIIAAVVSIVSAWFGYKTKKESDVDKQIKENKEAFIRSKIKELEGKIVIAMESDITSVAFLRKQLEYYRKELKKYVKIILIFSVFSLFSGCKTETVIIGERIFTPKPGDVITVPALKSPAKQWYLIDDKAMDEVLGIDKPVTPPVVIGVQKDDAK